MKKNITVSVDVEALERAKTKTENISKYLNECLIGLSGKTHEERTREQLEAELETLRQDIKDLATKEAITLETIRTLKFEALEREKQAIDEEQYKRWICPVCKHENFLEFTRCSSCNLPTCKDPKTQEVDIRGAQ